MMAHWTFAVMNASLKDPPEVVKTASVMGFVYVGDVDKDRRAAYFRQAHNGVFIRMALLESVLNTD